LGLSGFSKQCIYGKSDNKTYTESDASSDKMFLERSAEADNWIEAKPYGKTYDRAIDHGL
jgi:hypothetical protein